MPGFCMNCGAPITGAFCVKCGARAQSNNPQPQSAPSNPTPHQAAGQHGPAPAGTPAVQSAATPVKSSGLGKVLLVGALAVVVLMALATAGAFYGMYWVKHKISSYAGAVSGGSSQAVKVANGNTCSLLSVSDLQQILGVPVERSSEIMDSGTPGCAYYTNQAAFTQLQKLAAEQARRQSEEASKQPAASQPNSLPGLLKNANQMEGIVKTLGLSQPTQDGQVFSFTVDRKAGSDAWAGARLVQATVPGFEEVKGVGDRAMIGSFGHAFYAQKGDAIICLNTTWVPDARTRGSQIVNKILSNF